MPRGQKKQQTQNIGQSSEAVIQQVIGTTAEVALSTLVNRQGVDFEQLKARVRAGDFFGRNRAFDLPPFCDTGQANFRWSAWRDNWLADELKPLIDPNQDFPYAICTRANVADWAVDGEVSDDAFGATGGIETRDQILLYRPMWLYREYLQTLHAVSDNRLGGTMGADKVGQKTGAGEYYKPEPGPSGTVVAVDKTAATEILTTSDAPPPDTEGDE